MSSPKRARSVERQQALRARSVPRPLSESERSRDAAVAARAAAQAELVASPAYLVRQLEDLRGRLEALDAQRLEVVRERADVVARARAAGLSWRDVEAAAGVTRQALLAAAAG